MRKNSAQKSFIQRENNASWLHRRSQGGQTDHVPPKCLEKIIILCFERRFSEQSSVIGLKSNFLPHPKFLGWLRHCMADQLL